MMSMDGNFQSLFDNCYYYDQLVLIQELDLEVVSNFGFIKRSFNFVDFVVKAMNKDYDRDLALIDFINYFCLNNFY